MYLDPVIPALEVFLLTVLLVSILLKRFGQPYVLAYLLAGLLLGPHALGVFTDAQLIGKLGSFGVVLLLFFAGMELSLPNVIANWRTIIAGTLIQIVLSVAAVWFLGVWLDWPLKRVVLLGFVLSLSSTAVIVRMLQEWRELGTRVGRYVIGVSLAQDIAVVPMMIVLSVWAGGGVSLPTLGKQLVGAALVITLVVMAVRGIPLLGRLARFRPRDPELQVFLALSLCLGLARVTGALGLSTALGAFVAGLLVSSAREQDWMQERLRSFEVLFVGLFFASVGMLLDLRFLAEHFAAVAALVVVVFAVNTMLNAVILIWLGEGWRASVYAGALLSQIGEFSFVLTYVGRSLGLITNYAYQMTLLVISLTLLLSPLWIMLVRRTTGVVVESGHEPDARASS